MISLIPSNKWFSKFQIEIPYKVEEHEISGETIYYNNALGDFRPCSDICEPSANFKLNPDQNTVRQNNNNDGSWRFGLVSIPVVLVLVTATLYFAKKPNINRFVSNQIARCPRLLLQNQGDQHTDDIELQTINVSPTAVGNPKELQHLLGPRHDLMSENAPANVMSAREPETLYQHGPSAFHIGATVPLTDNELGPPIPSAQTSTHNDVLDNIRLTENNRLVNVPELPSGPEDIDHTTTLNFKNFNTVVIHKRDSLDCDVTVRTREPPV
ncbi:hypothetical protein MAR_017388 [Mya arenaria]|uniref:Uncharacterized protein n=1 Tax=Mya arenaria TaxID=6604 RepID=A0ABY7EBL7_MYAAR|nr:hypothetical protein MAR_017388 [Mya arenaria]